MKKMSKLAKILIAVAAVVLGLFFSILLFSAVVNINNCAGLICINIGG